MLAPRAQVACARLSAVVLAVTVVAFGALTPGYRPWADTVSRLGSPGQPHAAAARAAFVLYGLLVLAGTSGRPGSGRLVRLYGVTAIVAGLAPKDPSGTRHTLLSAVHVDATMLGGLAILLAMLLTARDGRCSPTRRRASAAAAGTTSVAAVAFPLFWGSAVYGLVERVVLAVPALWVALSRASPARPFPQVREGYEAFDGHRAIRS